MADKSTSVGDEFFASSDSCRSAAPLKYAQEHVLQEPLELELGGLLEQVRVVYETYGQLNADRSNAVLICHALSGDSHVTRHNEQDGPGWWDVAVGPGKSIDTDKYFVICPNVLGGCRGTTGPNSRNPRTGKPYGQDFPTITTADMVELQRRLVEHLGIDRLLAVIGGSMGGHQVLWWAARHGDRIGGAIPIATSARLSSQALAFDVVGRNAILRDPNFRKGQYYAHGDGPTVGLAIARMIGHITYLSREAMSAKFEADRLRPRDVSVQFEKKFSVGSYLGYKGSEFVERFDANSYMTLTMAMDLFDMGDSPDQLAGSLGGCDCRWLVVSFSGDWLFAPEESRKIVEGLIRRGREVSYCNVTSGCGHDAFLLSDNLGMYGGLVSAFLDRLAGRPQLAGTNDCDNGPSTHIFSSAHSHRLDYQRIIELIGPCASVLDLGCGSGGLLACLAGVQAKEAGHAPVAPQAGEGTGGDEDGSRPAPAGVQCQVSTLNLQRVVAEVFRAEEEGAEVHGGEATDGQAAGAHAGRKLLMGVELDEQSILTCVQRGLNVIHTDMNHGLAAFDSGQFDCVVLSQTLQAVRDVEGVVGEMLRVGRRCIVSFPNFAYHKLRRVLTEEGRSPEAGLLHHKWYNSPNIRFFSIRDFEDFCRDRGITVHRGIFLDTEAGREINDEPNANADMAIYVLSR